MKKAKILTISLLSLLLIVPFIGSSRAQVPAYIGVGVGDYYQVESNIYILESEATWTIWNEDNMSHYWGKPFGQLDAWADMGSVEGAVGKAGPINPIYTFSTEITHILEDVGGYDENWDTLMNETEQFPVPGQTLINASNGYYLVGELTNLPFETTYIVGNDSASHAAISWMGAIATTPFWAAKVGTYYFANSLFFAPTSIDWADFAGNCSDGLESWYDISANYSYTLDVNNLSNGFQLYSAAGNFGNNTEAITINVTYDADGVMENYVFSYGDNALAEIIRGVTTAPIFVSTPDDMVLPHNYTDQSVYWLFDSADPNNYAILTNDSVVLVPPTDWTIGYIEFDIPDGLTPGEDHLIKIRVQDGRSNLAEDVFIITVEAAPEPEPEPDPVIPGFNPVIVIGFGSLAAVGIILKKRKK